MTGVPSWGLRKGSRSFDWKQGMVHLEKAIREVFKSREMKLHRLTLHLIRKP